MLPAIVTKPTIRPVCKLLYLVALHEKKAAWTSIDMAKASAVSLGEVEEAFSWSKHAGLGHLANGSATGFVYIGIEDGNGTTTQEEGAPQEGLSSGKPKRPSKSPGA